MARSADVISLRARTKLRQILKGNMKLSDWSPKNGSGMEFRCTDKGAVAGVVSHSGAKGVPAWASFSSKEPSKGGICPTVEQARKVCDSVLKKMGYIL